MVGPVLQALVSRLASGDQASQEEGCEVRIATHHHSLEDALASMPTPDIQCIELDPSVCFEQTMLDGSENIILEPLDDFQLPPPAVGLDTVGVAGLYLTADNSGNGASITSEIRVPRTAATVPEEITRFWSLNLHLVPDSVEGSSQAPTEADAEEEKASAGQELCESSQAASLADQEMSAAAPGHSSPSCVRKAVAPLPMPYGCTVRVGRRRVAVRRARQVGTTAKRDIGCGGPSHVGRSRRRCQPAGVDWTAFSVRCNKKHAIQRDRRI